MLEAAIDPRSVRDDSPTKDFFMSVVGEYIKASPNRMFRFYEKHILERLGHRSADEKIAVYRSVSLSSATAASSHLTVYRLIGLTSLPVKSCSRFGLAGSPAVRTKWRITISDDSSGLTNTCANTCGNFSLKPSLLVDFYHPSSKLNSSAHRL